MFKGRKKVTIIFFAIFLVLFSFFVLTKSASAEDKDKGTVVIGKSIQDKGSEGPLSRNTAQFLSWIVLGGCRVLGYFTSFAVGAVIHLFEFQSSFTGLPSINDGWKIVRDVCNMFFVLVLLVIAFATILRMENYSSKKLLTKLLIMAVVINFSKTICYLLIDFSNVVMMTFANGFTQAGEANFINILGLQYILELKNNSNYEFESWNLLVAFCLAFLILLITLIAMLMFVVVLSGRIIMLWILIVLSPLAFFLSAVPGGQKYSGQWWGEFSKYLTVGPVLAFFVWLALGIASKSKMFISLENIDAATLNIAISEMGEWRNILGFVVSIGLLIGALKITQSMGTIGGSIGMNMFNKGAGGLKKMGLGGLKKFSGWNLAGKGLKVTREKAAALGKGLAQRTWSATGGMAVDRLVKPLVGKAQEKWRGWRAKNMDQRTRRLDAYKTGKYTDEQGNVFNFDKDTGKYVRSVKKGEEEVREYATFGGKEVEKLNKAAAGYLLSYRKNMSKAKVVKDKIDDEKLDKKVKEVSYLNEGEIRDLAQRGTLLEKQAAAINLANKDLLLKNDKDFINKLKQVTSETGSARKKIKESILKHEAPLWFNDLEKEEDIKNIEKALADGSVDASKQSADVLKNENYMIALQRYKGREFSSFLSKLAEISKIHYDNAEATLIKMAEKTEVHPIISTDGKLDPFRMALAGLNGDIMTAAGGPDNFNEKALGMIITGAKPEQLAKIDTNLFKKEGVMKKYKGMEGEKAQELVNSMKQAIKISLPPDRLEAVKRTGKASGDLIKELEKTVKGGKEGEGGIIIEEGYRSKRP